MVKDRKHKNWCSKHQRVHRQRTHNSCKYPNDNKENEKEEGK